LGNPLKLVFFFFSITFQPIVEGVLKECVREFVASISLIF